MKEKKKRTPHLGLKNLRSLCDKTSDEFARLTGVSYSLLVAVEQGRRSLSEDDAMLIASATGCDPEFNKKVAGGALKEFSGRPYDKYSYQKWVDVDLPELRQVLDDTKKRTGDPDVLEAILCDNISSIMAAGRAQGKDLALANHISLLLKEVSDRFGLKHALPFWLSWGVNYSVPEPTADGKVKQDISVRKVLINFREHDIELRTKFDTESPNYIEEHGLIAHKD